VTIAPPDNAGPQVRYALWAAVAGLIVAAVFTLSPLTVCVAVAVPFLLRAGGRGLPPAEARLLFTLLGTALALRVAAIAALFLLGDHDSQSARILVPDEAYTIARTLRIRNVLLGIPLLKYDYLIAFEEYGRTSYLWVVTGAQLLVGPSPYGLRLVNVLWFLAAAVLLFRLARRSYGPLPAFAGLTLLLFLPTWTFWSISLLKESLYFLLAATLLAAVVACVRAERWHTRLGLLVVAAGAVFALRDLRAGAVAMVLSGLVTGGILYVLSANVRRFVVGVVVLALVSVALLSRPAVQERVIAGLEAAAHTHIGHVFTVGYPYKLLDEGFYVSRGLEPSLTAGEAARFVVRAAFSIVFVPVPGQDMPRSQIVQFPEHMIWYALIALLPLGLASGLARDRLLTCLLVGYVLPTGAIVALTNGNIGTLVRFRGLMTPYLVWIGCLGLCVMMQRVLVRANAPARQPVDVSRLPGPVS
jgi:hypothetical protein